jgi:hypothetical protein
MTQQEQVLAEQDLLFSLVPDPEALQDVIDFAEDRNEPVIFLGNKIFIPSKDED